MTPEGVVEVYRNGASHIVVDEGKGQPIAELRIPDQVNIRGEVAKIFANVRLFNPFVLRRPFDLPPPKDLPEELIRIIGQKALYTLELDPLNLESDERSIALDFRPVIGMIRRGQVQEIAIVDHPNNGLAPAICWKTAGQSNSEFDPELIVKAADWSLGFVRREVSMSYPGSWTFASL